MRIYDIMKNMPAEYSAPMCKVVELASASPLMGASFDNIPISHCNLTNLNGNEIL